MSMSTSNIMFLWTKTISDNISKMMVGPKGIFKNSMSMECHVKVEVIPIIGVGSMWTINGDESDMILAVECLISI